jgi:glycosyltransferase involved in cell wall biosynthesis
MYCKQQVQRITLVIPTLGAGGAERVMSIMANYWVEKGKCITLITLDSIGDDFCEIHPNVLRVGLGLIIESTNPAQSVINNIRRINKLRAEIKSSSPDVVISFLDRMNVLTILATLRLGLKVIVSERSDPEYENNGRIWGWLRKLTYPSADIVVTQTEKVKQWITNAVIAKKVVVIPNPIKVKNVAASYASLNEMVNSEGNSHFIVALGRLSFEKGFDMLVGAFAMIAKANPDWRLIIFGEGEERDNLLRLVTELNAIDCIFLPGQVKNPMMLLKQSDLFVVPSRYEGFPNALLEAMACGLPVISFDCPSGPKYVIRDGIDGILVPACDVAALSITMNQLINDDAKRAILAARAPDVLDRFGLEKIMEMWERLLCAD